VSVRKPRVSNSGSPAAGWPEHHAPTPMGHLNKHTQLPRTAEATYPAT
jgi:hypothetical protein